MLRKNLLMSETQPSKSPLINIAASIVANFRCCNYDIKEQITHTHHNNGGESDAVIRSTSNQSIDIPTEVGENPEESADTDEKV